MTTQQQLIGSQKQIAWAEAIRSKVKFPAGGNPIFRKAIDTVMSIEYASFWIDFRDFDGVALLRWLSKGELRYKGRDYSDTMGMDDAGNIFYGEQK